MTVVKECATLEDAYLAKNLLENEGIQADILDEATASTAPYLLNSSGVRLAVADEDADVARQRLGLPPLQETQRPRRHAVPGWLVFVIVAVAIFSLFATSMNHGGHSTGIEQGVKKDYDRNGDGKIDQRVEFGPDGQVVMAYLDNNFDGRWDEREQSENGQITASARDLDFDGTYDMAAIWKNGVLQSETVTPGGTGFPLFRYDFKNGVLDTKWEDTDRDGAWNLCISYDALGRETGRKALK